MNRCRGKERKDLRVADGGGFTTRVATLEGKECDETMMVLESRAKQNVVIQPNLCLVMVVQSTNLVPSEGAFPMSSSEANGGYKWKTMGEIMFTCEFELTMRMSSFVMDGHCGRKEEPSNYTQKTIIPSSQEF